MLWGEPGLRPVRAGLFFLGTGVFCLLWGEPGLRPVQAVSFPWGPQSSACFGGRGWLALLLFTLGSEDACTLQKATKLAIKMVLIGCGHAAVLFVACPREMVPVFVCRVRAEPRMALGALAIVRCLPPLLCFAFKGGCVYRAVQGSETGSVLHRSNPRLAVSGRRHQPEYVR